MTEQENIQGFLAAIAAAEIKYGHRFMAEITSESLGEAVLMRPGLVIVPLPNWQPPQNGNGTIDNPMPTPPFEPPKVMNLGTNGTPMPAGVNLAHNTQTSEGNLP